MWYRRLLYLAALIGALLFQITNENYLGRFLLALCIALPLVSLALSLPGMLKCRLELIAQPAALNRGETGGWSLAVRAPGDFPLARLSLRLRRENLLTGQQETARLSISEGTKRLPDTLPAPTEHCGLLELRVDKAAVCDYLGLFSLRLKPPVPARIMCCPIPAQCRPVEVPDGKGVRPSAKSASRRGPGEDYELREYRPGDPLRSIHWKLTSKWDELIVREREDAVTPLTLLTIDRFGAPEELDKLLDRVTGMSRAMLSVQRPHAILWLDQSGEPHLHPVSDEREYAICLLELLSLPAPLTGPGLNQFPDLLRGLDGPVFRVHVTPEGGDGDDG